MLFSFSRKKITAARATVLRHAALAFSTAAWGSMASISTVLEHDRPL
jgi:uncharacterized protein YaiE (UPF0345 family)